MSAWTTRVARAPLPQSWRAWLWLAWWTGLALLAAAAAVVTEIASKRDASAARLIGQPGSLTYDAGWPFAYAHVQQFGLDSAAWHAAIHGMAPEAAISWPVLVVDSFLLALFFNMWIALIVASWRVALRLRRNETRRDMRRAVLTGVGVASVWASISAGIIIYINQTQPTDDAARTQILQPLHLVLLAPGVVGYEVQRWFESDAGANISLTGGLANGVEALAILALAVVLPAALLTMVALLGQRLTRTRHKTEENMA